MAGYSKTPLVKKLGIREGYQIFLINEPEHYFDLLETLPDEVSVLESLPERAANFIHWFVKDENELGRDILKYKNGLKKDGMLWISWPKGSSPMATEIKESHIRAAGLNSGLVDVKICAVDADWSGLKFVYRVRDR